MNPREAITRQIHGLLERERRINLHRFPIRISNADGVAVLEGEVGDIAAKKLALELAGSVPGVRGVVDRLRVAPGARPGEGRRGDGPVMRLKRVVLPLPFRPTTPHFSPASTVKVTSLRRSVAP